MADIFIGRRGVLHGELMIRSYQIGRIFQNAFSSNLKTVKYNIAPNYEEI